MFNHTGPIWRLGSAAGLPIGGTRPISEYTKSADLSPLDHAMVPEKRRVTGAAPAQPRCPLSLVLSLTVANLDTALARAEQVSYPAPGGATLLSFATALPSKASLLLARAAGQDRRGDLLAGAGGCA